MMKFFSSARKGGGSSSSWSIKTLCLVTLLQFLQTRCVHSITENFYNPDYVDEMDPKTSNELFMPIIPSSPQYGYRSSIETEDLQKRHMGAVAALSGGRDRFQQRHPLTPELLKRHLGSIASASGSKQRQILPQMDKRYLGSLASKSGFSSTSFSKGRPSGEIFTESKRHLGAMARINSKPYKRIGMSGESGETSNDLFYDYPIDNMADGGYDKVLSNPVSIKTKRFLGSLARGGWFPRQFRAFTGANRYDKRHIGSAARMGWLPLSKSDHDDNYFGEGTGSGFKRNIQYAAPANTWDWGSQRNTVF